MRRLPALVFFLTLSSSVLRSASAADMNAACLSHNDCVDGLLCHHPMDPDFGKIGICTCNPTNHDGCVRGIETCDYEDAFGSSFPRCGLPVGTACNVISRRFNDELIPAGDCHSQNCDAGMCRCDTVNHLGCSPEQVCLPDALLGYPECVTIDEGSLATGMTCQVDEQCETQNCFAGTRGRVCTCHPRTNQGCALTEECAVRREPFEEQLPLCYVPRGEMCESDDDCASSNCWQNECTCDTKTHAGCDRRFEMCVGDESTGFECVERVDDPPLVDTPNVDPVGGQDSGGSSIRGLSSWIGLPLVVIGVFM